MQTYYYINQYYLKFITDLKMKMSLCNFINLSLFHLFNNYTNHFNYYFLVLIPRFFLLRVNKIMDFFVFLLIFIMVYIFNHNIHHTFHLLF